MFVSPTCNIKEGVQNIDCYMCENFDWCSSEEMDALICPVKQGENMGINELRKAVKFIHRKNRIKDFEEYRKQTREMM